MIEADQVLGSWAHSHEEDLGDLQVFRPGDHPFPPSRGRTTFSLLPGHRAVAGRPGPDDRGTTHDGTWTLDGDVLNIALPDGTAAYHILAADPDRLELQPIPTSS